VASRSSSIRSPRVLTRVAARRGTLSAGGAPQARACPSSSDAKLWAVSAWPRRRWMTAARDRHGSTAGLVTPPSLACRAQVVRSASASAGRPCSYRARPRAHNSVSTRGSPPPGSDPPGAPMWSPWQPSSRSRPWADACSILRPPPNASTTSSRCWCARPPPVYSPSTASVSTPPPSCWSPPATTPTRCATKPRPRTSAVSHRSKRRSPRFVEAWTMRSFHAREATEVRR
jgi:hypothetical protein